MTPLMNDGEKIYKMYLPHDLLRPFCFLLFKHKVWGRNVVAVTELLYICVVICALAEHWGWKQEIHVIRSGCYVGGRGGDSHVSPCLPSLHFQRPISTERRQLDSVQEARWTLINIQLNKMLPVSWMKAQWSLNGNHRFDPLSPRCQGLYFCLPGGELNSQDAWETVSIRTAFMQQIEFN